MKKTVLPILLAALLQPPAAQALAVTLPVAASSTVEIESLEGFAADLVVPLGGGGTPEVDARLEYGEDPARRSLVQTELDSTVNSFVGGDGHLMGNIELAVQSSFSLYYQGSLKSAAGTTFDPGIEDPLALEPAGPFRFSWSADATALLDLTTEEVVSATIDNTTGAFEPGSNQVTAGLGVDLFGDDAPDTLTLWFDEVGVERLYLNGASLGGFSLDAAGNFSYDDSTFDEAALMELAYGLEAVDTPVISFGRGTLLVSGSVNPPIEQVTLSGDIVTSPVPLPAAGWLLAAALAGLGTAGRRRAMAR